MIYSLVGIFVFFLFKLSQLVHFHIDVHMFFGGVLFPIDFTECCVCFLVLHVGSWWLFFNSNVHMLIWSSSFLPAPHLPFQVTRSSFSIISLWGCVSLGKKFICICFYLEVISFDTWISLSPLLHLERSCLLSFLWLDLALFPTSLWLRTIVLCISSFVSIICHATISLLPCLGCCS